jgi:hypothetical protein
MFALSALCGRAVRMCRRVMQLCRALVILIM